ncbi:uncharacterized protein [Oscarella lobularis]
MRIRAVFCLLLPAVLACDDGCIFTAPIINSATNIYAERFGKYRENFNQSLEDVQLYRLESETFVLYSEGLTKPASQNVTVKSFVHLNGSRYDQTQRQKDGLPLPFECQCLPDKVGIYLHYRKAPLCDNCNITHFFWVNNKVLMARSILVHVLYEDNPLEKTYTVSANETKLHCPVNTKNVKWRHCLKDASCTEIPNQSGGIFIIHSPFENDTGYYQCFVQRSKSKPQDLANFRRKVVTNGKAFLQSTANSLTFATVMPSTLSTTHLTTTVAPSNSPANATVIPSTSSTTNLTTTVAPSNSTSGKEDSESRVGLVVGLSVVGVVVAAAVVGFCCYKRRKEDKSKDSPGETPMETMKTDKTKKRL